MESNKEIGERIATLRKEKGLTQAQLAKELYVARQTVVQWEKGERDLKTDYTARIAEFFNKTCDYIIRGVDAENTISNTDLGLSNDAVNVLRKLNCDKESNHMLIKTINYLIEQEAPRPNIVDDYAEKAYDECGKPIYNIYHDNYIKALNDWESNNCIRVLSELARYFGFLHYEDDEDECFIFNDYQLVDGKELLDKLSVTGDKREFLELLKKREIALPKRQVLDNALYLEVQKAIMRLANKIKAENTK